MLTLPLGPVLTARLAAIHKQIAALQKESAAVLTIAVEAAGHDPSAYELAGLDVSGGRGEARLTEKPDAPPRA